MTFKVAALPNDEVDQLEAKLNKLAATPDFIGFELAGCLSIADTDSIVLIFQKNV